MTQKSSPNLLLSIENKLNSGGTGNFVSAEELYRLFQLPLSPEVNLTLLDALEQSSLDPDVTLLQILPHADNNNYLIPLALCIRGGANVNMYVDAPNIGVIHLLAYVYFLLGDPRDNNPVVNTIAAMLVAAGSRTSQSVYDRSRKRSIIGGSAPELIETKSPSRGGRSLREPTPPLSAIEDTRSRVSRLSMVDDRSRQSLIAGQSAIDRLVVDDRLSTAGQSAIDNRYSFNGSTYINPRSRLSPDQTFDQEEYVDEFAVNTPRFSQRSFSERSPLPPVGSLGGELSPAPLPISTYRTTPTKLITVSDWLANQKYRSVVAGVESASELAKRIPLEMMVMISILLDAPQLTPRSYQEEDMYLAIRAFSMAVLPKIPASALRTGLDYKSLLTAEASFNSAAFTDLLSRGQMPSYLLINRIILDLKRYQGRLPFIELQNMLRDSVTRGVTLDQDQLTIIGTLGQNTLTLVNQAYAEPYWRKVCRVTTGAVPEELRMLAASLNLNTDAGKGAICENLSLLSAADKQGLKDAARRKQQLRMMGEVGYLSEFLEGKIPDLVPRNRSLMPQDPFTYNDNDIVFYRDDQGSIWAFGREMFATILESKTNPYSSAPLPAEVLVKIEMKNQLSGGPAISFDNAIDHLDDKDSIGNNMSAQVLQQYANLANRMGVPSEVALGLSKADMSAALRAINLDVNLDGLTTSHALTTVAYTVVGLGVYNPALARTFFQSLNRVQETRVIRDGGRSDMRSPSARRM